MEAVRSTRKTLGSLTAIGICGLLLSGCASVPDVSPAVGHASVAQKPKIVTRSRALSSAEIKDVVARLTLAPGDNALLQHHLAIEQAVADAPLVAGETAHILRDGPATFRAMFAAIRSAKRRIDLEYYIFENVESDGVHLADLLLAKRAEGVAINIIYDDYGSGSTPQAFFDESAEGQGRVEAEFARPPQDFDRRWRDGDRRRDQPCDRISEQSDRQVRQ
jgi:cardiolipin synthase